MPAEKTAPEKTVFVHPEDGVTIYTGGRHAPFEPGRAVPLPESHANDLIAAKHAMTVAEFNDRRGKAEAKAAEPAAENAHSGA